MVFSRGLVPLAAIAGGVFASDNDTCADELTLLQGTHLRDAARHFVKASAPESFQVLSHSSQTPQVVVDGCPRGGVSHDREVRAGTASTARVRCCSMDGSSCESGSLGCQTDKTFFEAQDICASAQLRLCTEDEIESNVCCGSGCGFDSHQVWASPPPEPHVVVDGCPRGGVSHDREVRAGTAKVRCCSMDGSSCESRSLGCQTDKTFFEAQDICASAQMRLCTEDEIESNVCCGSGCNFDSHQIWASPPPEPQVVVDGPQQFTPDQADWSTFRSKPALIGAYTGHDPDGSWMSGWEEARWDGVPIDPSTMRTKSELQNAICASGDKIRGIREVFYQHNPFADVTNPTKAEVDEWHRIAINHVRALVGYTSPERQVKKDHCLFARALWGQQRMFTTQWDDRYPGRLGSAYGPCQGAPSRNAHCGASFVPSAEDQAEFLPEGHEPCTAAGGGAEGISSAPKSDIPWSVKWSRALCGFLGTDGFRAHTGPFFHREKFGFSFWDANPSDPRSNAVLRGKWGGQLMENLYPEAP